MHASVYLKRVRLMLMFLMVISLTCACESQPDNRPTAKEVCSYIAKEMGVYVPTVPTLCVPKSENVYGDEMSVFSPTDVLEGKMRRAWSTALFVVFSDLYFGKKFDGFCKGSFRTSWFGCTFLISDSYLSQNGGEQYKLLIPDSLGSYPSDPIHGDPASDDWYKAWWFQLGMFPQYSHPGSSANARSIAEGACSKYIAALKRDSIAISQPDMMPIPDCSVLLTTGSRADVIINFSNWLTPSFSEYERFLPESFGKSFDGTPYSGSVIFRSAWTDAGGKAVRSNWFYDLRQIEFTWDEISSGVRSASAIDLSRESSQTELHALSEGAGSGIVLRIVETPGRGRIMDLTNGSQWLLSDAQKSPACRVEPGEHVVSITTGMLAMDSNCEFNATLAGAW